MAGILHSKPTLYPLGYDSLPQNMTLEGCNHYNISTTSQSNTLLPAPTCMLVFAEDPKYWDLKNQNPKVACATYALVLRQRNESLLKNKQQK